MINIFSICCDIGENVRQSKPFSDITQKQFSIDDLRRLWNDNFAIYLKTGLLRSTKKMQEVKPKNQYDSNDVTRSIKRTESKNLHKKLSWDCQFKYLDHFIDSSNKKYNLAMIQWIDKNNLNFLSGKFQKNTVF